MPAATDKSPVKAHSAEVSLAEFGKMAEQIPEVGGDGMDAMVARILSAESPEQLSSSWQSDNTRAYVDRQLQILSVKRAASDFADGWGIFLVVEAVNDADGEHVTFTTGSQAIVLQLVMAHAKGWLPLDVVVRQSKRPTKDGYYPLHLEVLGVSFGHAERVD